jgi:AcrR family transcriptional regulator
VPQVRERRTNAERTEETRAALLAATIELLGEVGYGALTTREVAVRAGVSRGAQTHHFPTKADLVAAAIEHLFAEQISRFRAGFEQVPPAQRDLGAAVGMLWDIVGGPSYVPVLELIVAARTDDELRVVVHAMTTTFEHTVADLLTDLFPGFDGSDAGVAMLVDLAFSIVQGAAVSALSGFGDPERTIHLARTVAGLITPATAEVLRTALASIDPPRSTP